MTSASSIAILEKNIFRPGRSERFIHSFLRKLLDGEWASLKHGSKPWEEDTESMRPGIQHTEKQRWLPEGGTPAATDEVKRNQFGVNHEAEGSGKDMSKEVCCQMYVTVLRRILQIKSEI